ncbi:HET-domain-containing protein [Xylariaceae sp. FL1651]|nr:HET-domain-containing protein [Xylariaceae sp. FL1651]
MSLADSAIATTSCLCQQCQVLFSSTGFEQLISTGQFRHSQLGTFADRPYCRFCRYLWGEDLLGASSQVYKVRRLRDVLYPASGNLHARKYEELQRCWVVLSRPVMHQYVLGLDASIYFIEPSTVLRDADAVNRVFVSVETEKRQLKWQGSSPLRFIAPKSSPLAKYTNFRPLAWNGLTSDWVKAINAMLRLCLTSHPRCQPSRPRVLPTRLLHIEKTGETNLRVQLVTTVEGHTGEYAALSYCWGGPQQLQLTKATVHKFLQQPIERQALPKGLSDAVGVTHALELEYLWVDALCIVQDDQDDKKQEISRMSDIYQNSFVTIAAATSSSVNDSFLCSQSGSNPKHPSCNIPFTLDTEDSPVSDKRIVSSITVAPVHTHRSVEFPLNKRGWAFQEALLPPRLLVFGDLEPFVRCRTKNVIGKSQSYIQYGMSAVHPKRIIDSLVISQDHDRGLFVDTMAGNLDFLWREIVEQYTLRELSFLTDRQYAISGVVDFLSGIFNDECYFGVWKSCAVVCLLWKTEPLERRTIIPDIPTWSWMSVTGAVDLEGIVYFDKPEAIIKWDAADTSHARLLVMCCVLEAEGVYGDIQDIGSDVLIEAWPDVLPSSSMSDQQPTFEAVEKCAFLVLCQTTNKHYLALVVTEEEGDVYHRCGVAELNLPDSWRTRTKQIVLV